MEHDTQVWEILQKSRYIDLAELSKLNPSHVELAPVNPEVFELVDESLILSNLSADVIDFARNETEKYRTEYSVLLCGRWYDGVISLNEPHMEKGEAYNATFSYGQCKRAERVLRSHSGEVVYGHTHVRRGSNYRCFSLDDLAYLVERAISTQRNTYGLLITCDDIVAVRFDRTHNEFYRVNIHFC